MTESSIIKPHKVIIDTDVSIGIPEKDVDDGLALVMACNSKQLSISAITLTYGNSTLKDVSYSMRQLNKYLNFPGDCISQGAGSAVDLGIKTKAIESLIAALECDNHSIICLGPLTNIATLIKLRPDLIGQIDKVILVAGRRPGYRFLTGNYPFSHPDLNFEKDSIATAVLLQSGVPLIFAPFELSSKIWITKEILETIKSQNTEIGDYLYLACLSWLEFWQKSFSTTLYPINGFNPFDCLAVACLTDASLLVSQNCNAVIEVDNYDATEEKVQGTKLARKEYLHVYTSIEGPHRFAFELTREDFLLSLIQRLK